MLRRRPDTASLERPLQLEVVEYAHARVERSAKSQIAVSIAMLERTSKQNTNTSATTNAE